MKLKKQGESKLNFGNYTRVIGYESWCGALPSPQDIDNPLGYKFSWAPQGALGTSQNDAIFLKDGKVVKIEGKDLMRKGTKEMDFHMALKFEGYPNRDSCS